MVEQETSVTKFKMYSDAPIKDANRFNFDAYSDVISKIILNKENKTPFSIGINGTWGRGKTTLMRTIREKLKIESGKGNNRKVKSVWFNAWKYSETDSILSALVFEIFEEMSRGGLADKLKVMKVGGRKIKRVKVFSDIVGTLTQARVEIDRWLEDQAYKKNLSFYDLFQTYMKKILMTFVLKKEEGEYSDKEGVLVIFIDDLDRCPPKQITKVLESINLFFDQKGCFFVFGIDVSMISEAINRDYKVKGAFGKDYIKKMIQLQFDLPAIGEEDIMEFMEKELEIEDQLKRYFEIIIKGLESNQREIKRFLNSLNLMKMLGESIKIPGYEEELLIKWSILNFSSNDFIKKVNKNPELLKIMEKISRMEKDRIKTFIETQDDPYKEPCKKFSENEKILKILQSGEKNFEEIDINSYIFLSSVAPKEPDYNYFDFYDALHISASASKYSKEDLDRFFPFARDIEEKDARDYINFFNSLDISKYSKEDLDRFVTLVEAEREIQEKDARDIFDYIIILLRAIQKNDLRTIYEILSSKTTKHELERVTSVMETLKIRARQELT